MKVEILNATVVSIEDRRIKLNNGEERQMQVVHISTNTSRGVKLDGVEVWDDQIEQLNLKQGQRVNLTCDAIGRLWGGRFSYTLMAYKAQVVEAQQATQNNNPVDMF